MIANLLADIRYSARNLAARPAFAATVMRPSPSGSLI